MKLAARAGANCPLPHLGHGCNRKSDGSTRESTSPISRPENRTSIHLNRLKQPQKPPFVLGLQNTRPHPASMNCDKRLSTNCKWSKGSGTRNLRYWSRVAPNIRCYNLAEALLEAGDEVIIPVPYWVSYADQTLLNDATPVFLPTREEDGYAIDAHELERLITPRTKAIIINSPSNPTGATYDRKTLERLAELALHRDFLLISDEIYEKILYDGATHTSIASLGPEVAARTVVINGVSKAYAMTGWRIGYAAGPKDLLTAMANIQSQSTSNPCSISQKAAVVALREGGGFTEKMVTEFDRRRHVMVERLNAMPGVRCRMPTGAFYAFPMYVGCLESTAQAEQSSLRPILQTTYCRNSRSQWFPVSRLGASSIFACRMRPAWRRSFEEWIALMQLFKQLT